MYILIRVDPLTPPSEDRPGSVERETGRNGSDTLKSCPCDFVTPVHVVRVSMRSSETNVHLQETEIQVVISSNSFLSYYLCKNDVLTCDG